MKERDCLRRLNPTTWIHYKYRYRYRYRYIYIYRPYRYSLWHSGNERDWQRTEPHHLDALRQQDGWTFDFNSEPHATLDGIKGHLCCSAPPSELSEDKREQKKWKWEEGDADESEAIQCNVKLRIKILPLIEYMVDLTDKYCWWSSNPKGSVQCWQINIMMSGGNCTGLVPLTLLTCQNADAGSYLCTGWLQSVNADKWANKAMFVCQSILSWRSRKQYKWKQIMI